MTMEWKITIKDIEIFIFILVLIWLKNSSNDEYYVHKSIGRHAEKGIVCWKIHLECTEFEINNAVFFG